MKGFDKKKQENSTSKPLTPLSKELIEKLAYYNHLKYPCNSDLDNWYLAIEEYNNE